MTREYPVFTYILVFLFFMNIFFTSEAVYAQNNYYHTDQQTGTYDTNPRYLEKKRQYESAVKKRKDYEYFIQHNPPKNSKSQRAVNEMLHHLNQNEHQTYRELQNTPMTSQRRTKRHPDFTSECPDLQRSLDNIYNDLKKNNPGHWD